MNKNTKIKPAFIGVIISITIFIILAIISAFFDLAINKALYNPEHSFGQYFANTGELPLFIFGLAACIILYYQNFFADKKKNMATKVIFATLTFAGCFITLYYFGKRFTKEDLLYPLLYMVMFSIFFTILCLVCGKVLSQDTMNKLLWFALFIIIVLAFSNILVQVFKVLWDRQRFRTMTEGNPNAPALLAELCPNYKGFTPWYKINLFKQPEYRTDSYRLAFLEADDDAFKSFPSGHTVAASASFSLIILPDIFDKFKRYRVFFWAVPIIYTLLVGISRIVVAAHYLSDVLFGGYIGFAIASLTRIVFLKKINFFKIKPFSECETSESCA
ncbi:MAG: phosphatase PAP2 family protein [Christensenellales bacterium]|jgi:membrane-associated phospholipid phosphatase